MKRSFLAFKSWKSLKATEIIYKFIHHIFLSAATSHVYKILCQTNSAVISNALKLQFHQTFGWRWIFLCIEFWHDLCITLAQTNRFELCNIFDIFVSTKLEIIRTTMLKIRCQLFNLFFPSYHFRYVWCLPCQSKTPLR